jgi:hypothetical protein
MRDFMTDLIWFSPTWYLYTITVVLVASFVLRWFLSRPTQTDWEKTSWAIHFSFVLVASIFTIFRFSEACFRAYNL